MNVITIVIWIIIAIIGIVSSVLVRKHFSDDKLETTKNKEISDSGILNGLISSGKDKIKPSNNAKNSLYPNSNPKFQSTTYIEPQESISEEYEASPIESNTPNYEYDSPNQVLINYENEVKKFQEPIKQTQMDIMTQNKEKTELKDLFTIDELIEESKRKDSERLKESQTIEDKDEDLTEIKESIKKQSTEPLIEEILEEEPQEETVSDLITEEDSTEIKEKEIPEIDPKFAASQKDIEEAITTASQESEDEEIESISESDNITDVLLNADDEIDIPNEEIKEPALKTPNKVGETKDYELGASIDDANLFEDNNDQMDLDYRKDLDKITNKIKGSKIFQDVKDKLVQEKEEIPQEDESYIRNVNEYDEFEPIINATHVDFDASYEELHVLGADERLRQENTRKVFNMAKNSSKEPELAQPIGDIKNKPSRDNIKITLNNNEVVLKKGDEIIFNHLGETYSSQVYAINGDDISVRYRRKDITIKPTDVKKIY